MSTFINHEVLQTQAEPSYLDAWSQVGERKSIAGVQVILRHDDTKTKIILSEDGQEKLHESEFTEFLGRIASMNTLGFGDFHDIFRNSGIRAVKKSVFNSHESYSMSGATANVFSFEQFPDLMVKTQDKNMRHALRQFDVMNYLKKKLENHPTGINALDIYVPSHYAVIKKPGDSRRALVMERALGSLNHKHLISRSEPGSTNITSIRRHLFRSLGFGSVFLTDLRKDISGQINNVLYNPDHETTGHEYALIDQPRGNLLDHSKLILAISNAVAKASR